jgi:hypothetical protein
MFADKILAVLFLLLLNLFPNYAFLQNSYRAYLQGTQVQQPHPYDARTGAALMINALETQDIPALEALMCKNIKDNEPNLRGEIGKMTAVAEGGITESSWDTGRYSYISRDGDGHSFVQVSIDIYIHTSNGRYVLNILWESSNNFDQEEVGIRRISMRDSDVQLVQIKATERSG